jgi:hypothetical protein
VGVTGVTSRLHQLPLWWASRDYHPTDARASLKRVRRPTGIVVTTILMAVCNAMGWFIIDYSSPHARAAFIIFTILISLGYLALWGYWRGKNWARILVLITSVVAVLNIRGWNSQSVTLLKTPSRVMLASESVLGIFLLVWLNRPSVRAFFKGGAAT